MKGCRIFRACWALPRRRRMILRWVIAWHITTASLPLFSRSFNHYKLKLEDWRRLLFILRHRKSKSKSPTKCIPHCHNIICCSSRYIHLTRVNAKYISMMSDESFPINLIVVGWIRSHPHHYFAFPSCPSKPVFAYWFKKCKRGYLQSLRCSWGRERVQ